MKASELRRASDRVEVVELDARAAPVRVAADQAAAEGTIDFERLSHSLQECSALLLEMQPKLQSMAGYCRSLQLMAEACELAFESEAARLRRSNVVALRLHSSTPVVPGRSH